MSEKPVNATVRLDQFLKLTGVVGTGGQAKIMIQSGEVKVNGETEIRRKRQLVEGDEVAFFSEVFVVECNS